jgi:hypothetical protein
VLVEKVRVLGCFELVRKGLCLCQRGFSCRGGGVTMPIMHVEGEDTVSPISKVLESSA